jgi:hypothetical protein
VLKDNLNVSLLEDLEQEAQKRKASADDAQQRKVAREEFFKVNIEPRMAALADYLQKLVANLKVLKPATPRRYTLPGYGEVIAYSDHDYDLKLTTQADSREIKLGFGCTVAQDECALVEMEGIKVKALAGTFARYQLGGAIIDPKKDGSGDVVSAKFRARGRIVLAAGFNADADGTAVKMSFANVDAFGTTLKTVSVGQLNEALFDDIGRYLTGEESGLFREALPDDYRAQLRSTVERDKVKRRWEFKIASRRKTELDALKAQHGGDSLFGRLRTLVKKDK